jgi:parvulin-like peptidyl-prolyl isomerase
VSARLIAIVLCLLLVAGLIGSALWTRGQDDRPRRVEARELAEIVVQDEGSARRIARRARDGEDFQALAREERFDGNWKLYTKRDFEVLTSREVAEAAFNLPAGGTTMPVRSAYGWHVVQVVQVLPAHR